MTTLHDAARQALEALTAHADLHGTMYLKMDAITALRAALEEPQICVWQQDSDTDSGVYGTSCGHYFNLEDGTPEDNKMQWCCYCGKKLAQELIEENEDD